MGRRFWWAAVVVGACLLGGVLFAVFRPSPSGKTLLRVGLDFFPNPNHAPLYAAIDQGFFSQRGLRVELVPPTDPSGVVRLAAAGSVDIALTPQMNYLIARDAGLPLVAIAALIGRPLGGLLSLAEDEVQTVRDLKGKRIGYSLAPLEPALWRTVLSCAGLAPDDAVLVNVGMNTVAALLLHQVDAIGAFRNVEPIEVALQGKEPVFFPQESYCVPETCELIAVVNRRLVEERPEALRAFVAGLADGIAFTLDHPDSALAALLRARPDLDDELNRRSFEATLPLYAVGARLDDDSEWEHLQGYLLASGLVSTRVPPVTLYWNLSAP